MDAPYPTKSLADTGSEHEKGSSTQSNIGQDVRRAPVHPAEEKKLLRKIDWNLIPILFLIFLCAFMDRINIGNARIQGLEASLDMTGSDYNIALFVFFITYIVLEVPSNMLLKKLRPSLFLGTITIGWGIITVGQGVTRSFAGLVVCRLLMGVFEAGLFPGCVYLISMYYKRHELQWRINLFFSASIIAGAFSGLLAYALAHMDGIGGQEGWRWIFIIEGIFTVLCGIVSIWLIPDWPHSAKFLTEDERALLEYRLSLEVENATMNHWDKQAARRVFGDIKIYLGIAMYLGIVQTSYSTSFFTPTILRQLGYTSLRAQLLSIPVFAAATVTSLLTAVATDRLKHRFAFIILGCLVATVGFAVLLSMRHVPVGARYFALFAITCGGYITQPVTIVWLNNNLGGHYKRGVGAAMQIGIGNIGGIIASLIYLPSQMPTYHLGFGLGLALVWVCVGAACANLWYLKRENRKRDRGDRDSRFSLPEGERSNLGDDHPSFRFVF